MLYVGQLILLAITLDGKHCPMALTGNLQSLRDLCAYFFSILVNCTLDRNAQFI